MATRRVGIGLILAPPLLAGLISVMGIEELRRAVDAGNHLARLERQVARRLGAGRAAPLRWETKIQSIRSEGKGFTTHWWRTCALFVAGIPAIGLGVASLIRSEDDTLALGLSGALCLIFVVACLWFQRQRHIELTNVTRTAMGLGPREPGARGAFRS